VLAPPPPDGAGHTQAPQPDMIFRILFAIGATIAVLVVFFALIRLAWGLLGGAVAFLGHGLNYLMDGLAWLWRQARWSS
jgi:hypothetical protein